MHGTAELILLVPKELDHLLDKVWQVIINFKFPVPPCLQESLEECRQLNSLEATGVVLRAV